MNYFLVFVLIYNLSTFFLMGFDKLRAKKNARRVREKYLLSLGLLVGAFGFTIGMVFFRHKTRKIYFSIIYFLECILNIFVIQKVLETFN